MFTKTATLICALFLTIGIAKADDPIAEDPQRTQAENLLVRLRATVNRAVTSGTAQLTAINDVILTAQQTAIDEGTAQIDEIYAGFGTQIGMLVQRSEDEGFDVTGCVDDEVQAKLEVLPGKARQQLEQCVPTISTTTTSDTLLNLIDQINAELNEVDSLAQFVDYCQYSASINCYGRAIDQIEEQIKVIPSTINDLVRRGTDMQLDVEYSLEQCIGDSVMDLHVKATKIVRDIRVCISYVMGDGDR